jgi:hypothetical protein
VRLPADNRLALAPGNDQLVLDRSDRPAPTREALLALAPSWVREAEGPVRDAVLDALAAQANLTWARVGQALAQAASPRNAAGVWLDAWGEFLHRPRVAGEGDGPLRARLLTQPDVVTPSAIRGAVERLVAEATAVPAVAMEPAVDAVFAAPVVSTWSCFAQPATARLWPEDPSRPGERWGVWSTPVAGALFWVVLPAELAEGEPLAYAEPAPGDAAGDSFAAPAAGAWAFAFAATTSLFDRVIGEVEPRRGGGVAWMMFNDPLLFAAV